MGSTGRNRVPDNVSHSRVFRRAYHFLPANYAIDDLSHRRLKIARIDELNDPFDLWAIAQPDPRLRLALKETKKEMDQRFGMLCFSKSWHNPLLWSHYAERHRGIALGFDISSDILRDIYYVSERPVLKTIDIEVAQYLLFTKYIDWQYEQETRVFTALEDRDPVTAHYFADFNDQLILREVIVGPLNEITKDLQGVLAANYGEMTVTKARLAFNTFQVVTDQRGFRSG
jgi:hypothetical protein